MRGPVGIKGKGGAQRLGSSPPAPDWRARASGRRGLKLEVEFVQNKERVLGKLEGAQTEPGMPRMKGQTEPLEEGGGGVGPSWVG